MNRDRVPGRPRVAIVSSLFGESGGGAGLVVQWMAESLASRDYEACVITTRQDGRPSDSPPAPYDTIMVDALNLYSIHEKERYPKWLRAIWQTIDTWNPSAFHFLRRAFASIRPDVVHVHKLRGYSPAVWHAARAAGVQVVVQTCQDFEVMSPEGTLSGPVGRMAARRDWRLRPYQSLRSGWSRRVSAVTAPSAHTLSTITDAGFFREVPSRVIPNSHGFSTEQLARLRREPVPEPNGPLRLLYLGRLVETKGVDVLCGAVASSAEDLVLDIAGWGEAEDLLRARWSDSRRITFRGPVSGRAKESLLASCDALVVPSIWPEVFGIVIAEALAFGKPAIGTTVGGIPEVIAEGETGLLVPPDDGPALGVLLSSVTRDRSILRDMRNACFDRAPRFATDTVCDQYLDLYTEIGWRAG